MWSISSRIGLFFQCVILQEEHFCSISLKYFLICFEGVGFLFIVPVCCPSFQENIYCLYEYSFSQFLQQNLVAFFFNILLQFMQVITFSYS